MRNTSHYLNYKFVIILAVVIKLVFVKELMSHRVDHNTGSTGGNGHRKHARRELATGGRETNLALMTAEAQNNSEVVAQVGGTATIRCYTLYLGDELVTWLKRDDQQILTAGQQVYSSENRYSVSHVRHQKLWELTLLKVQPSDAGVYECQLTTHPPVSLFFNLRVVQAFAVIKGPKELHVHEGSKLKLHCTVEDATEPLLFIFWFHNSTMVNHNPDRPSIVNKKRYGSILSIANVRRSDAGEYRCEPHLATPANVTIHVLAGENPAAMQRGRDGITDLDGVVDDDKSNSKTSAATSTSFFRSRSQPLWPSCPWTSVGPLMLASTTAAATYVASNSWTRFGLAPSSSSSSATIVALVAMTAMASYSHSTSRLGIDIAVNYYSAIVYGEGCGWSEGSKNSFVNQPESVNEAARQVTDSPLPTSL